MPTAWAAIPGRDRSNVCIAIAKPWPSSPSRLPTGTRTPSKASSAVGEPADAHLVLEAGDLEAGPVRLDEDRRQPAAGLLGVRVGDGEHDHVVRDAAVADEPLGAVDHVLVAVTDGPRPDPRRIRAGVRLREREGDQLRARGEVRQPAVLLLRSARHLDRDRAQRLDGEDQARRRAHAADLLDREAQREQVPAQAAVALRERDREDVVVGEEAGGRPPGTPPARSIVGGPRRDLLVGEHADGVPQEDLLLREADRAVVGRTGRHRGHRISAGCGGQIVRDDFGDRRGYDVPEP